MKFKSILPLTLLGFVCSGLSQAEMSKYPPFSDADLKVVPSLGWLTYLNPINYFDGVGEKGITFLTSKKLWLFNNPSEDEGISVPFFLDSYSVPICIQVSGTTAHPGTADPFNMYDRRKVYNQSIKNATFGNTLTYDSAKGVVPELVAMNINVLHYYFKNSMNPDNEVEVTIARGGDDPGAPGSCLTRFHQGGQLKRKLIK